MVKRNPIAVFFLCLITFGIYAIFWYYWTKHEMVAKGADIPTMWLLLIPIVNIWWMWKYCQGVEKVTKGHMSGVVAFILIWLLNVIGIAILQNEFNQVA